MRQAVKDRPSKASQASDAAPSFRFVAPKLPRVAKGAEPSAEVLAKVHALSMAGVLPPMVKQGFDIGEVMKLYAAFKPLIDQLLPLIGKLFKKDKPDVVTGPIADPEDPGIEDPEPAAPVATRIPSRLESKVFWIARKRTPYQAGGGRYLLSDDAKRRVVALEDPLQAGDRVCFDDSPYDQHGKKYEGEKPFVLEHRVGGVGELQQQEDNDYTPVVFVPWEGGVVVPGFQGEITYQAAGGGLESKTIRLRVRPWKA